MSTTLLARGLVAASALVLAAGLAVEGVSHAAAGNSADAGQLIVWGTPDGSPPTVSDSTYSVPLAQVEAATGNAILLTASGKVVMESSNPVDNLPSELADRIFTSVATNGVLWAAVPQDGEVEYWGSDSPAIDSGDIDTSDVVQVALGGRHTVGLKHDGTVVAWGANDVGQLNVPDVLTDADEAAANPVTKVVAGTEHSYALRSDGTVMAWGRNQQSQVTLPAALSAEGAVKDVEARSVGGLALLNDGSVVSWGAAATFGLGTKHNLPPASLSGKTVVQIDAGGGNSNVAIDSTGGITVWGSVGAPTDFPEDLDGSTVSSITVGESAAFAIQRKVMTISESAVAGSAKEGQTLTGTPASFSGGPEITYEWLADDVQIDGATETTLQLTKAEVGKKITFRTVATVDDEILTSDSPETAAVAALAPAVAKTKTKIKKIKVKKTKKGKKNGKAVIKIKVAGKNKPAGKVKVVVKKGKKKVFKKTLKLNKKAVAKAKAKKLKKGKYKVVAQYQGNAKNKKSKAKKKFRVK